MKAIAVQMDNVALHALREASGLDAERLLPVDQIDDLLHESGQGLEALDALIIGPEVDDPIRIAQRLYCRGNDAPVLILCRTEQLEKLKRAIQRAPLITSDLDCVSMDNVAMAADALLESMRRRQQRRALKEVIDTSLRDLAAPTDRHQRSFRYIDQLLDCAPMGVITTDASGAIVSWNTKARQILGCESQTFGASFLNCFEGTEKKRLETLLLYLSRADVIPQTQTFFRNQSTGSDQVIEIHAAQFRERVGEPGMLFLILDVTERVSAERNREQLLQRLRASEAMIYDLAGRLIHAQEQERQRLARQLHDDLSQRLAALSIKLSLLKRQIQEEHSELLQRWNTLQDDLMELHEQIRNLSHELHPAMLQNLGLQTALRALCAEFADLYNLDIRVSIDLSENVPQDIALCLFRVSQESLYNIAKHSGSKLVHLLLSKTDEALELTIEDNGAGFDPGSLTGASGLGIVSMQERVRFLNGICRVDTAPGQGTTVRVAIPVSRAPLG